MSHEGRLRRGEADHELRDRDGNYPDAVNSSKARLDDIAYFLDNQPKPKESKKSGK